MGRCVCTYSNKYDICHQISHYGRNGILGALNSLRPKGIINRHRSCSTLVRVRAWCLTASSHYINECCLSFVRPTGTHSNEISSYRSQFRPRCICKKHYGDVIMGTITSQITSLAIIDSTVYSDENQRKHQSSASLAFVRKCFHLMTSSWRGNCRPFCSDTNIITFAVPPYEQSRIIRETLLGIVHIQLEEN